MTRASLPLPRDWHTTGTFSTNLRNALAELQAAANERPVIDPRDYGPMPGDWLTDVTSNLAQAVTDAAEVGGTVVIPTGGHVYQAPLVIGAVHLEGPAGTVFSRTAPTTDQRGAFLVPYSSTANLAAIQTTVNTRGVHISGIGLDLRHMADGSTDDPFTRAQTKGIHIDGTWNWTLTRVYVIGTPSKAAAIYVDKGVPLLGAYWGRLDGVFVDSYTKRGMANGYTTPLEQVDIPAGAKDQSARGIVLNGINPSDVTAVTAIDTTSYRGWYLKNVDQFVAINSHAENSPAHGVYMDAGQRITWVGGFNERPGFEAASGDSSIYRTFKGVNSPARVNTISVAESGTQAISSEFAGYASDDVKFAGYGFPSTVQSAAGLSATPIAWPSANRAMWFRVRDGGMVSAISMTVGTSSGNISVSVNAGIQGRGHPGPARAVSGSVACPASGDALVNLTQTVDVFPGDWIGLSCDNTTATFFGVAPGLGTNEFLRGLVSAQDASHPIGTSAPSSAVVSGARVYAMSGVQL